MVNAGPIPALGSPALRLLFSSDAQEPPGTGAAEEALAIPHTATGKIQKTALGERFKGYGLPNAAP